MTSKYDVIAGVNPAWVEVRAEAQIALCFLSRRGRPATLGVFSEDAVTRIRLALVLDDFLLCIFSMYRSVINNIAHDSTVKRSLSCDSFISFSYEILHKLL